MSRTSNRENKNYYQITREDLGLSREKASELLESIPPERIERIESEKSLAHPEEILIMAGKYKSPNMCNYYCANDCPIGRAYVPEIKVRDLSQIVLEMIAAMNLLNKRQERLVEITVDGQISDNEIKDFVMIQKDLEQLSISIESLQLWSEKMIADGRIDMDLYHRYKSEIE